MRLPLKQTPKTTNADFLRILLSWGLKQHDVDVWLRDHPPPNEWKHKPYAYAFTDMPTRYSRALGRRVPA